MTFLDSTPSLSQRISTQIRNNVTDILHLHQEILAQMKQVLSDCRLKLPQVKKDENNRMNQASHSGSGNRRADFEVTDLTYPIRKSTETLRRKHTVPNLFS